MEASEVGEAREHLGPVADAVEAAVADLLARDAVGRAWRGDHTLWQDDPTEVSDRLGWLHSPAEMKDQVADLRAFAAEVSSECTHAVVMGMGGSSLFPEVLTRTFGSEGHGLELAVLDTTDPAAVARLAATSPEGRTLFLAASKSGTTIETLSHLAYFRQRVGDPTRFVAVTDPGSALGQQAASEGFRRVFENRPDIGGRYSALSHFGLVPAALLGVDLDRLLDGALAMAAVCGPDADPAANPAVRLGAAMGAAARSGRDKLTVLLPDGAASFGLWLEQLVAESTGKRGTGVVPVTGEPLGPPGVYGHDRLFVSCGPHTGVRALQDAGHPVIELPAPDPADPASLGAEVLRWELATALAGAVLAINPFDQPDVAAAKAATGRVLDHGLPPARLHPLAELVAQLRPGDYLAVQAYLDPESVDVTGVQAARMALRDHHHVATTLGLGPRFLHSTGQLHKGGPPTGVFVQVVGNDAEELPIPGRDFGFSTLKHAQAAGDLQTLQERGLRAGRVALSELLAAGT
jgi:transaldolase / glucose-6-phosphate isomerase